MTKLKKKTVGNGIEVKIRTVEHSRIHVTPGILREALKGLGVPIPDDATFSVLEKDKWLHIPDDATFSVLEKDKWLHIPADVALFAFWSEKQ